MTSKRGLLLLLAVSVLATGLIGTPSQAAQMGQSTSACLIDKDKRIKRFDMSLLGLLQPRSNSQGALHLEIVGGMPRRQIEFDTEIEVECFPLDNSGGGGIFNSSGTLTLSQATARDVQLFDFPGSGPRDCFVNSVVESPTKGKWKKRVDCPAEGDLVIEYGVSIVDRANCSPTGTTCFINEQCCSASCLPAAGLTGVCE